MAQMDPALDAALTEAMVLARRGDGAATERCTLHLRRQFDVTSSVDAMVRLMLAEGIGYAYDGVTVKARDRVWRALHLSEAGADSTLRSIAQAWMSFLDYEANDYGGCAANAFGVLKPSANAPPHAQARASSVIGCAYQICGDSLKAKAWFDVARQRATSDGDALMTSSTIFNMAATRFSNVRLGHVCDPNRSQLDSTDMLFLSSSETYDWLKGYSVRGYLHVLMRAFANSAKGEYERAICDLDSYLRDSSKRDGRSDLLALVEISWCHMKLSRLDPALTAAREAAQRIQESIDLDDLAVAHRRLADVFAALGDAAAATHHGDASRAALGAFRQHQQATLELLDAYGVEPPTA